MAFVSKVYSSLYLNSFVKQLAEVSPRNGNKVAQFVRDNVPQTVEKDLTTMKELQKQRVNLTFCASALHAVEGLEKFGNLSEKDPKPQVIVAEAMGKIPAAEFYMKKIFPKTAGLMGKTPQEQVKNLVHPRLTEWTKKFLFNDFIDLRSSRCRTYHEKSNSDAAAFVIKKCGYNEYFQRHGRPDAATAVCLADKFWMDAMNASPGCLNACRRPSTISTGGKECRFEFVPKRQEQVDGSAATTIISDDVVKKALEVDSSKEDNEK